MSQAKAAQHASSYELRRSGQALFSWRAWKKAMKSFSLGKSL